MAFDDRAPARGATQPGPAQRWTASLGGGPGILLRLAVAALAAVAASEHVLRQSSLVVLLGFVLAGSLLAAPLARYAAVWLVFSLARGLAEDIGLPNQGGFFAEIDRWLGLGVTPTERLQDLFFTSGQLGVIDHAAIWVHASYYFVPHAIAIGVWWICRNNGSKLFETYLRATIAILGVGLVLYVLLPTSPPWLETYGHSTLDVTRIINVAHSDPAAREQIYTVFTDPNPIAAMPSLHTAITALAAWVLWQHNRRLGLLATLYAVLMGVSLVYLGEHYLIDILAGLAVTGVVVVALTRTALAPAPEALTPYPSPVRGRGEKWNDAPPRPRRGEGAGG